MLYLSFEWIHLQHVVPILDFPEDTRPCSIFTSDLQDYGSIQLIVIIISFWRSIPRNVTVILALIELNLSSPYGPSHDTSTCLSYNIRWTNRRTRLIMVSFSPTTTLCQTISLTFMRGCSHSCGVWLPELGPRYMPTCRTGYVCFFFPFTFPWVETRMTTLAIARGLRALSFISHGAWHSGE